MPKPGNDTSRQVKLAFTLVELLVVIAIIGILATVLFAAISQGKGKALRVQCANNVRQLGVVLQTSVTDNGVYPLAVSGDHTGGHWWMAALQYNALTPPKNDDPRIWLTEGVWKCPAANTLPPWPTNLLIYMSYGYNGMGLSRDTDTNGRGLGGHTMEWSSSHTLSSRVSESEVVSPSEMMAIGDGLVGGNGIIRDGELVLWRTASVKDYSYPGCTERSYALHNGKANVVFCDGHVESPTLKFLFEDTSDAALVRWNRDHLPHRELLGP